MHFLPKFKSGKKKSILQNQRQKHNSKSALSSKAFWFFLQFIVIFIVLVFGYRWLFPKISESSQEFSRSLNHVLALPPNEWKIEIHSQNGDLLPDDITKDVFRGANKILKFGTQDELKNLKMHVESLGMLDSVRVFRPLQDEVHISADIRIPILLIVVGNKTRFVSRDGSIFGDALDNIGNPLGIQPKTTIFGIFESHSSIVSDHSTRIMTSPEENEHILDALDIAKFSDEQNFAVKSIQFKKYRGFSMIQNDDCEIVLGFKPYEYKLKKLKGIVDNLQKEHVIASRIELDYEGKAFIKERKL